jgi:NADH dehydrogenase
MKVYVSGATGLIGKGVLAALGNDALRAAAGADAVLHIGVDGLQAAIDVAGARRFVLASPDPDAEELVRRSELMWTIIRPSLVYGPGDETVSRLMKAVRTLPAIPMIDADRELQPIWYEDLAKILVAALARNDLAKQVLDARGPEITTTRDLLHRLCTITGRSPALVPLPALSPVREPERAASAIEVLGVQATPIDRALRLLADSLPPVLPDEGVGSLEHKHFHADISGSRYSAAALMMQFRERVNDFMPLEFAAEPGAPERIELGTTLTGHMPVRGHFQVRIIVAEPRHVVFATVEGHPLAGIIEFTTSDTPQGVRFAIDNFTRGSNVFDLFAIRTLGAFAQSMNWREVVERAIAASGGTSDGVHESTEILSGGKAEEFERRARTLANQNARRNALRAAQ